MSEWLQNDFDVVDVTPPPATAPTPPPPQEIIKEIDLGDGSGKQVFKAATYEELTDKLVEAQRNATLKIQQLAQQAVMQATSQPPTQSPMWEPPAPMTPEEEFLLAQQFASNPSATFKRLFEANTGMPIEELPRVREYVDGMAYATQIGSAVNSFLANHEGVDYHPCKENQNLIENFLQSQGLDLSLPNLEYAHSSLSRSGLLVSVPPDEDSTTSPFPTTMQGDGASPDSGAVSREAEVKAWLEKASADEIRAALKSGAIR